MGSWGKKLSFQGQMFNVEFDRFLDLVNQVAESTGEIVFLFMFLLTQHE